MKSYSLIFAVVFALVMPPVLAGGVDSSEAGATGAAEDARVSGMSFDPPPAPTHPSPGLNASVEISSCSYAVKIGDEPAYADMQFKWEYRYSKDADNDGKKDADPKWELTSFSAANIRMGVPVAPASC